MNLFAPTASIAGKLLSTIPSAFHMGGGYAGYVIVGLLLSIFITWYWYNFIR
jgi:hypothetical protein